MSTGTLGGEPCTRMRLQWPSWGCPWLEAETVEPVELTIGARVTAQIADLTFQGTVVSGYARNGTAGYRVVGGAGGWGNTLPAKSYHNDAGIKIATPVGDAAAEAGETVTGAPTDRIGVHFARPARRASWVLNALFPRGWYVGLDGTTVIGQRAAAVYIGEGVRTRVAPASNLIELDIEAVDNLAPGISVDGSDPAADVELVLDHQKLLARVFSARGALGSRRLAAWSKLLDALLPDLLYRGTYEFRVESQSGERFNLDPVLSSIGLDPLEAVPVRGPAGYRATVANGELVLVTFVNAQPDRPVIIAHDDPEAPGFVPSEIDIGGATRDFLATKTAVDTLQQAFDQFTGTTYPMHTHPAPLSPTGPISGPAPPPVGALPHTDILKSSHT